MNNDDTHEKYNCVVGYESVNVAIAMMLEKGEAVVEGGSNPKIIIGDKSRRVAIHIIIYYLDDSIHA